MAAIEERSLGVARLYARAMLSVASDQGVAESLGEELDGVIEEAERDPEFERFLLSPVLERERRRRSLETALRGRASDLLVDSLQVINKKDRLGILPQIVEVYHQEHRELLGQLEVRIKTAIELTDAQRDYVRERTKITTGKDTYLVEQVDPDLLGGLVIQVGDEKIDMSVRRDLELLSRRFADRLSKELTAGDGFVLEQESAARTEEESSDDAGDQASASRDGEDE